MSKNTVIIIAGPIVKNTFSNGICELIVKDHKERGFLFKTMNEKADRMSKWPVGEYVLVKIFGVNLGKNKGWQLNVFMDHMGKHIKFTTFAEEMPTLENMNPIDVKDL